MQLPLTLRQPVDVLLKDGQLSGEARIPGEPWLRRDTRWLNIPWLKADGTARRPAGGGAHPADCARGRPTLTRQRPF